MWWQTHVVFYWLQVHSVFTRLQSLFASLKCIYTFPVGVIHSYLNLWGICVVYMMQTNRDPLRKKLHSAGRGHSLLQKTFGFFI